MTATLDKEALYSEFRNCVNLTPKELEAWLAGEKSRSVGQKRDHESEAVGHPSGPRIVEISRKKQAGLDEDDYAHLRKAVGYVHRHLKRQPSGDISETRWRDSLMNGGHDPLKSR